MLNVICVVGSFYAFMIFMVSIMLMRESSGLSFCPFGCFKTLKKSRNENVLLANGRSNDLKSNSFEKEMSLVLLKMTFSVIQSYWVVIFAFINSKEEDTHWVNLTKCSTIVKHKKKKKNLFQAFVREFNKYIFEK